MNNTQIQIQFPRSGQWDQFTLTAVYRDVYREVMLFIETVIGNNHEPEEETTE